MFGSMNHQHGKEFWAKLQSGVTPGWLDCAAGLGYILPCPRLPVPVIFSQLALAGVLPALVWVLLLALVPLPTAKPYSRVILDRHGQLLHAFLAADDRWRLHTESGKIPERLKAMLLAREDRWFEVHPGVNPLALARAALQNLEAGGIVSGGSTLTMQIARMLEPKERTYRNKLIGNLPGLQLEWHYSKAELLELYCSMVPLGGNIEGMQSGALLYYQTPLERLNAAQIADLILIPSDPNRLRPDLCAENLLRPSPAQRQNAGSGEGVLAPGDSSVLWNTPACGPATGPPRASRPTFASAFATTRHPRLSSTRRLDLGIQRTVESLLSAHSRQWKGEGVRSGAVIVLENQKPAWLPMPDRRILPMSELRGQVDAIRAIRSPGSTLKPLLYAHAMDLGKLTPRKRLLDVPYDAEGFEAENYDGDVFRSCLC